MTLRFEIRWDNHLSPLIADAVIYILVDDIGRPPDQKKPGSYHYTLPDGISTIEVNASFTAHFGAVKGDSPPPAIPVDAPAMAHQTLRIEQKLEVVNGKVRVVSDPRWGGKHPLVKLTTATSNNGVTLVRLRTRFVDITPLWEAYAAGWSYYTQHRDPKMRLRVLGYTGGKPLIWFASFPKSLEQHSFRMPGALVFFRPANYAYTRVDQPHQMGALIRYLTKPVPGSSVYFEEDHHHPSQYFYIRCGFEDALARADRPVVMLHPWPSGSGFGHAQTRKLRALARDAVRYLWADQHIYRDQKVTGFGRLGLAGFSLGGAGTFGALGSAPDKIDEVYLFDCTGSAHARGTITRWFLSRSKSPGRTGSPCLRMAGGAYNINTYASIRDAVAAALGKTTVSDVTATPSDATGWDAGANALWDHVIKLTPHYRNSSDPRHQFTVHGGQDVMGPGPFVRTYLYEFVENSRFGVVPGVVP